MEVKSRIFVTSDTHFGCNIIVKRENRPFKNVNQCNRFIVRTWNKQANKNDIIYHLGDFVSYNQHDHTSWSKSMLIIKKIKAKVILIIGNNEERIIDTQFGGDFEKFRNLCLELGFKDVKKEDYITIANTKFYLNHYPSNHKDDMLNLFGHTHRATGLWKPFGFNMDVDLNHFMLFNESEIKNLLRRKNEWWDSDANTTSM